MPRKLPLESTRERWRAELATLIRRMLDDCDDVDAIRFAGTMITTAGTTMLLGVGARVENLERLPSLVASLASKSDEIDTMVHDALATARREAGGG